MEKQWIILIGAIFAVALIAFVSAKYYTVEELQKYDYDGKYSLMFEKKIVMDGNVKIIPPAAFLTKDVREVLADRLEAALAKKKMIEQEKVTSMTYTLMGKKYLVSILPPAKTTSEKGEVKVSVGIDKIMEENVTQPAGVYVQGPEEARTS